MRIYTRTGDDGQTGLFGGQRVPKDDMRVEACGTVDELNAVVGIARTPMLPAELGDLLEQIQHELFAVGAELASPTPDAQQTRFVNRATVQQVEQHIDRLEAELSDLTEFILPAGVAESSVLHLARCVCRRAERRVVTLRRKDDTVSILVVEYLNRLGDLLFVLARSTNAHASVPDEPWSSPG